MKEAEYHELQRWGWECPQCKNWNEEDDDPSYQETIFCPNCDKYFIPAPG